MSHYEDSKWNQGRSQRLTLIPVLLLVISLACNLPTALPIINPNQQAAFVETSVAATLAAVEIHQPGLETAESPGGTQTPGESTPLTQTPTDLLATPGDAKIYMSENTNCRTGQGTVFERLMILLKGEEAELVGVDTSGDYWYIRRPDQPTSFCWLWGRYATPTGPYESVPVYTQIPTPTPGFVYEIAYHSNIGFCGGFYVLQYRITNTGSPTLESWKTSAVDHTGGSIPLPNQQDKFTDISGCVPAAEQLKLSPGETSYVNAMFTNDPVGHDITVTVQICTENGLGGSCLSKTIRHTP